jgi:hypothetical protein
MSQGIQSTQQVPNPLLNNINAPPNAGTRVDAVEASVSDQIRPDGAPSAPVVMKPIEPGRRGRIFSIDIDSKYCYTVPLIVSPYACNLITYHDFFKLQRKAWSFRI